MLGPISLLVASFLPLPQCIPPIHLPSSHHTPSSHQELPLSRRLKRLYIVSVSQFRPEKQHALQLRAFARARRDAERLESDAGDAVLAARLELVGGCRNAEDAARIEELKGWCWVWMDETGRGKEWLNDGRGSEGGWRALKSSTRGMLAAGGSLYLAGGDRGLKDARLYQSQPFD